MATRTINRGDRRRVVLVACPFCGADISGPGRDFPQHWQICPENDGADA